MSKHWRRYKRLDEARIGGSDRVVWVKEADDNLRAFPVAGDNRLRENHLRCMTVARKAAGQQGDDGGAGWTRKRRLAGD